MEFILKSVYFKKTAAQSSFLSKVLPFLLTLFWFQQKWQHFLKKWGLCDCVLKMNGSYYQDMSCKDDPHTLYAATTYLGVECGGLLFKNEE